MDIPNASPGLYNEDLAPAKDRRWGAFSIFNVWTSDVHSLWGYYLAASLFLLCGSFFNFIIAIGLGSLVIFFLMNAVAGRIWCGYLCPQTVWTDLFLAIERWTEGDRRERMKND